MLTETARRSDFPALADMSYLNTAAESIPPRCVGDALEGYWRDKLRGMRGRDAHFARYEACREVAARFLGLLSREVAFCSCSSEAYNLLASALQLSGHDEVVVNDLDFPAGVTPWLRAPEPPVVQLWKAVEGELHVPDLAKLLTPRTRLVQVSLVSFFNGHRLAWPDVLKTVRTVAPEAVLAVDVTQALGRVPLDCAGADIMISSTHKWSLGIHGGCIVGVPGSGAERLTTRVGGWYHLHDAFGADRFTRAEPKTGALSFAVGMPNFPAIYALDSSLRYLEAVGVPVLSRHADRLVGVAAAGLRGLGLNLMCPWRADRPSGILAFRHARSAEIHAGLERENIHVMHHAGRIRVSVHGYTTESDIDRLLNELRRLL